MLALVSTRPAAAAERRPVEGRWEVQDARLSQKTAYPARHYYLVGEEGEALFLVEPSDRDRLGRCQVTYDVPKGLMAEEDPELLEARPEAVQALRFQPSRPGTYPLSVRIEGPEGSFVLTYDAEIVVVEDETGLPSTKETAAAPMTLDASPGPADAEGVKGASVIAAPVNYARVHGVAATYEFPTEDRRYMLRGVKLELWDSSSRLKTVYSSDATGEGNCGIDREDYIDTNTGVWHHVSDSGWFDFGDVYVGTGKNLYIAVIFEFYATATGDSTTGIHRVTVADRDNSDATILQWWNLGMVSSTDDRWVGLYNSTYLLSSTNGLVSDEAMHAHFDMARMYRYYRDCTGHSITHTTAHIWLSNTSAPSCGGDDMYMRAWDNGYLTYHYTDSIRHEYSHAMHYKLRGGSFPPWGPGDTNHGNCANASSSDALAEGFARYAPTVVYRDGVYHWTATSTQGMSGASDYCADPVPDERHEWAVGQALWKSWDTDSQTNSFVNCAIDTLGLYDPDYVEDYVLELFSNCSYDYEVWAGFFHNSMNYDSVDPWNPSSVWVTPNRRWTNDTTPTWSWSGATDDRSRIDGYGIWVSTAPGQPSATKDIEEVETYTPGALADGNAYYFDIRSVDNAGNWASGYSYQGPIGIDTVQPGAPSLLQSTSHTVGAWSNNGNLTMVWTAAGDDRSGVDGYGIYLSSGVPGAPGSVKDIGAVATYTETGIASSAYSRYFNLRTVDQAGNWDVDFVSAGPYYIDVDEPGLATGLVSTSHVPGVWSNDTTVDFTWTAAPDPHSGVDGYGLWWSPGTAGMPGPTKDIEEVTAYTQPATSSTQGYYFNLRSVDNAGNWDGSYQWAGPYYIETILPTGPVSLYSTSHAINTWYNDATIDFAWVGAHDEPSGIDGYGISWTTSPAMPGAVKMVEETPPNMAYTAASSPAGHYFNIRAVDNAGNWEAGYESTGPFLIDTVPPGPASGLNSLGHPVNSCTTDSPTVKLTWSHGLEADSGLAGYSYVTSTNAPVDPDKVLDMGPVTHHTEVMSYSPLPRYFNLTAADLADNWSFRASHGPFIVDRTPMDVSPLVVDYVAGQPEAVELSWTPDGGASGYQIDRSLSAKFLVFDTFTTNTSTWVDVSPPAGTVIYYRVRGQNACGVLGS